MMKNPSHIGFKVMLKTGRDFEEGKFSERIGKNYLRWQKVLGG
jgi:hypothetical protein